MKFLVYAIISTLILFLSYRISFYRVAALSIILSIFILSRSVHLLLYERIILVVYVNLLPIIAERFKKDFEDSKEAMRTELEGVKGTHEGLVRSDQQQNELNLEKEKNLQNVLSLYEVSKDMSTCLAFEDIFNIFSSILKKSFRFRVSRIVLLKESNDIESVYQIELGQRINKVASNDFDKELIKIALESKKTISISEQERPIFFRRLSIIKDFETLISIPLIAEGRISAILYIENIPRVHFENFIILTGQFAIQFQRVFLYKKVQEMSITDSLTDVSTRRYFLERTGEEIRRSMRHKSNLSFLMLDLDYFKEKNDRYGHLVGDVILKEVANILKSSLREIDIIGRYGGEEFAIVLAGIGREGAFQVAERIRRGIEGAVFKAYDESISTSVSIGIGVFPEDAVDIDGLVDSADKALYRAKETGRNRVC